MPMRNAPKPMPMAPSPMPAHPAILYSTRASFVEPPLWSRIKALAEGICHSLDQARGIARPIKFGVDQASRTARA